MEINVEQVAIKKIGNCLFIRPSEDLSVLHEAAREAFPAFADLTITRPQAEPVTAL